MAFVNLSVRNINTLMDFNVSVRLGTTGLMEYAENAQVTKYTFRNLKHVEKDAQIMKFTEDSIVNVEMAFIELMENVFRDASSIKFIMENSVFVLRDIMLSMEYAESVLLINNITLSQTDVNV